MKSRVISTLVLLAAAFAVSVNAAPNEDPGQITEYARGGNADPAAKNSAACAHHGGHGHEHAAMMSGTAHHMHEPMHGHSDSKHAHADTAAGAHCGIMHGAVHGAPGGPHGGQEHPM